MTAATVKRREAFQLLLQECQQLLLQHDLRIEQLREQAARVLVERDRVLSTVIVVRRLLGDK